MTSSRHELFEQLRGEQLSSVEFVQDYLQLRFDGPTINVMTPITVTTNASVCRSGDDQFRNALCEQISKIVLEVVFTPETCVDIRFVDGSGIAVSLRPDDYDGTEAVYYHGFRNEAWGVI